MKLVMSNLIHNAFKFTRHQNKAKIEFRQTEEDGHKVYSLADNGIGFDMQYVDKIFKPFETLHDKTGLEGTGVGLAIVQRIIHRHGGKIWAKGRDSQGATVYFTLPE